MEGQPLLPAPHLTDQQHLWLASSGLPQHCVLLLLLLLLAAASEVHPGWGRRKVGREEGGYLRMNMGTSTVQQEEMSSSLRL